MPTKFAYTGKINKCYIELHQLQIIEVAPFAATIRYNILII